MSWPVETKPRERGQSDPDSLAKVMELLDGIENARAKAYRRRSVMPQDALQRSLKRIRWHMHAGKLSWDVIAAVEGWLAERDIELFDADVRERHQGVSA